jgi:hypothetical protein
MWLTDRQRHRDTEWIWVDFGCWLEIAFWVHFGCWRGICILGRLRMFERDWILGILQILERDLHLGARLAYWIVRSKWEQLPKVVVAKECLNSWPDDAFRSKSKDWTHAIPHWGLYAIKVHDLIEIFLQLLVGSQKVEGLEFNINPVSVSW